MTARRRWTSRAIAIAVVVAAASLAGAAPVGLYADPAVVVITTPPLTSGSGMLMLVNPTPTPMTVSSLDVDGTCAPGVYAMGMPDAPFTVAPKFGTHTVVAVCPGTATQGIRRCRHSASTATFTTLCLTHANQYVFTTPSNPITLADAPVNTTGTATTVTVTNVAGNPTTSAISIQIADHEGDISIGAPCLQDGPGCDAAAAIVPGGSLSISAMCTPKTAGVHTVSLYVVADTGAHLGPVTLTCTGLSSTGPALSPDKTSITLATPVGTPATSTLRLTNVGDANLDISSIAISGTGWSYSGCAAGCTLMPTAFVDVIVAFLPSVLGSSGGTLTINSNDPLSPMFPVTLLGTGQGATLAAGVGLGMPPMIDLGDGPVGVTLSRTFVLRNDGNIALPMVTLTTSSGEFGVSPSPTTIAASGMQTFTATCTPSAPQPFTGTIVATAPSAITGSPLSIDVRCRGTTGSFYAVPSAVDLGEVRVGTSPPTVTIMLRSVGPVHTITAGPTLAMNLPAMSVTPATPSMFSMMTPASFTLDVEPTADADLANTIQVTAELAMAAGTTIDIPVTGRIVTPDVAVPDDVTVGSFCIGQPTMSVTSTLTATGTASIELPTQPVMGGMAQSPFQLTYTSPVAYPYLLPAASLASVEIQPLRQTTAGTRTDDLVWATDAPGKTAPRTKVTAEFIAQGGAIAPQFVDFGGIAVRARGPDRVVRIQNCGSEPLRLFGMTFSTEDFFDASPLPLPAQLMQNQTATIFVGFQPRQLGNRRATMTVDSSNGPLNVTLAGNGLGDPGKDGEARSFYACDCGSGKPAGGWLAVVVLALLRRRRRRSPIAGAGPRVSRRRIGSS